MSEQATHDPISLLQDPTFFNAHVWPLAASASGVSSPKELKVKAAQVVGTERATVEYRVDNLSLFAKYYAEGELGTHCYEVLSTLWEQGFGPTSLYSVPKPLGYLSNYQVLLMMAAPGECLKDFPPDDEERWNEGIRAAARWLAALHSSPLQIGVREDRGQGLFRLAKRLIKASARHPEAEDMLRDMIGDLADRAASVAESQAYVQSHGRYHTGHVFITQETVTAIDLDRSCPANPAKDVAEFLHRLRSETGKGGLDDEHAERATLLFLNEYLLHSGADLSGLAYYWSYSVLSTFLHLLRKHHLDRETREYRLAFYRTEFDGIPQRLEGMTEFEPRR